MGKEALEGLIGTLDNWAAFFTLLVVIGVGGELAIHILQSRASKRLSSLQHSESLEQQLEIERLKLSRAQIEERLAPRTLIEEQREEAEHLLKRFAGTPYTLTVAPVQEALDFAGIVDHLLLEAGWNNKPSSRTDFRTTFTLATGSQVEQAYFSKIRIRLAESKRMTHGEAADTLISILEWMGLDVETGILDLKSPDQDCLHIFIGSKE